MSIFVAGDIHGELEIYKVKEFFEKEKMNQELTKKDYLIILGDCGICWDNGYNDEYVKKTLSNLPVTTLWIDGNHENFDLLNDYDTEKWNGGNVHFIEDDIIHLMRGQVFKVNNLTLFTFGGASSTDKFQRREGISWWKEEMPSMEEYNEGIKNLNENQHQVDYVFTHTAPYEVILEMGMDIFEGEEELVHYLQSIADEIDYDKWMFGHFHVDEDLENFHALYDRVIKLENT